MYSLQGLWSQAREGLHVVTIICANRAYSILKVEMARERIVPRCAASRALAMQLPTLGACRLLAGTGCGTRAAAALL